MILLAAFLAARIVSQCTPTIIYDQDHTTGAVTSHVGTTPSMDLACEMEHNPHRYTAAGDLELQRSNAKRAELIALTRSHVNEPDRPVPNLICHNEGWAKYLHRKLGVCK